MAKATEPRNIVVAVESFVGGIGGSDYRVTKGDMFESDDPVVKKWPALFVPLELRHSSPTPRVEQATAAPGEKRGA